MCRGNKPLPPDLSSDQYFGRSHSDRSVSHPSLASPVMPASRFDPSSIKNKIKREEIARKQKKEKRQGKLQKRLAQAKAEADDPLVKKVCYLCKMHA